MECKKRAPRAVALLSALLLCCVPVVGAQEESPITSPSARARAMGGGTSAAYGGGLDAIYLNPVALSEGRFSLTALESSLWVRSDPRTSPGILQRALTGGARKDLLSNESVSAQLDHGFGFGGALGIGVTGGGFGLGLRASMDSFSFGQVPERSSTEVEMEIGFAGGVALPFEIGPVTLTPAVGVRPFVRIHAEAARRNSASMLARFMGVSSGVSGQEFRRALPVLNGYGFSVNGGIRLGLGAFFLSAVARDVAGTPLQYSWDNAGTVLDSLARFGVPAPAGSSESGYIQPGSYVIPMRVSGAIGFEGSLGERSTMRAYVELGELRALSSLSSESTIREAGIALVEHLHVGTEIGVGRIVALRGGFDRGRPSAGVGFKLGVWELDAGYSAASLLSGDARSAAPVLSVTSRVAF